MSVRPVYRRITSDDPSSHDKRDLFSEYHFESEIVPPHPHSYTPPPYHHHHANESLANARAEWSESPDAYFIKTKLPTGIRREDVRAVVEDEKLLKINICQRPKKFGDRSYNSRGKFETAFVLPEDARASELYSTRATYNPQGCDNPQEENGLAAAKHWEHTVVIPRAVIIPKGKMV